MSNSSAFSRAVNEMHAEDVASCFKGSYVSARTWELTYQYLAMVEMGSQADQGNIALSEAV